MARKTLIQIRKGSKSDWETSNPTLASGEMAYLTDFNKILFGDGNTNFQGFDGWNKPWIRIDGGNLDA